MTEIQLALELLAAFAGGFFVAVLCVVLYGNVRRRRMVVAPVEVLTLYDHDGVPLSAQLVHAEHFMRKGFHREWVIAPVEVD